MVRFGLALVALAIVAAGVAHAEPPSAACGGCPSVPDEDVCRSLRLAPYAEHGFAADLERDRGTLIVERLGLLGTANVALGDGVRLRVQFGGERARYDLSDPDEIVAGAGRLLEDAVSLRLEPRLDVQVAYDWAYSVGPLVGSQGALGAPFHETLTYGAQAAVRFPVGSNRTLRVGAAVETTLEGPLSIWPLFEIGGGLSTGGISIEGRGSGVRVGIPLSPKFSVGAAGRYDRRDWRLAEEDRVPLGVFRDIRLALGADVEWKPSCSVVLSVAVWATVYHKVRIVDRDGDRVTDFGADSSLMVSFGVSVLF